MWYILALNSTAPYQVNSHLPNLKRWSDLLINRQHTQNILTDEVYPIYWATNKDWRWGVETIALMLSQSTQFCKLLPIPGKKMRGKGGVSEGEIKCSETVIKALTLMATKELSQLRFSFNEVAVKMLSQHVWRLNPPLSTEHINEKSGRKSFSTLPTGQPQLWPKRNTSALQMLFRQRGWISNPKKTAEHGLLWPVPEKPSQSNMSSREHKGGL